MAEIKYNRVYVIDEGQQDNPLIEVKPEYVYMTIPADWACTYQKLLVAVADFGEQMLHDCQASCKNANKNIINCWHMFASAIAAHQLGQDKLADTLMKYINAQLKVVYRDERCAEFDTMVPLPISEDGRLKALIGCDNDTKFYVDLETGELLQKYGKDNNGVFVLDDDNLTYETNE